jgi:hypothetical protein
VKIAPITRRAPVSQKHPSGLVSDSGPGDRFECHHEHHSQDGLQPQWGFQGHGLVQEVAAENLPEEVPQFFRDSVERLVGLASQPDRWKARDLKYLREATSVDHFMAYEQIKNHDLPDDRFGYVLMIEREGLNAPGQPPKWVGTLPYKVAELFQNLTLDFAIWRNEGQGLPPENPRRQALEENALLSAGLLGHYVGDAAQPLHSTVHHDGWNEKAPNPNGFRTRRGLHREFETQLVAATAKEEEIHQRVAPARQWEGDPLDWGLGLVAESNGQVERLYQLEKNGDIDPRHPSEEGANFLHDRMAVGAQNLRDLWFTAWKESKRLAGRIDTPR